MGSSLSPRGFIWAVEVGVKYSLPRLLTHNGKTKLAAGQQPSEGDQ